MSAKSILIVEDDSAIRETIKLILEMEGYSVLTASNGAEGVDVLKSNHPGLILLDLNMPIMDGREFLRVYGNEKDSTDVPVVVISAGSVLQRPTGAREVFKKPIELDGLLHLAHRYCDSNDHRSARVS